MTGAPALPDTSADDAPGADAGMGRGTAAQCDGRSGLGRADRTRSGCRDAGTGIRRAGHPGNARLAQWLRRGRQRGGGGQTGLRRCPRPGAILPGR